MAGAHTHTMVGLHVGGCNKVPPSHNQLVKDGGGGGGG